MKPLIIALVFSAGLWLSPRKEDGGVVIHISNSFNGAAQKTKPIGQPIPVSELPRREFSAGASRR